MTADPTTMSPSPFQRTVTDAHREARAALVDGHAPMDAVVWLSAHLAAVARVIEPAARRDADPLVVGRHHDALHALQRLLRVAERRHSGDALASAIDSGRLSGAMLRAIRDHEHAESELLQSLERALPAADIERLSTSYRHALEHAPTRPHPHAPHHGVFGAIAFRVDAVRDRVMNTMDSRHVPLPRVMAEPPSSGRWGSYLLGQMQPGDADTAR